MEEPVSEQPAKALFDSLFTSDPADAAVLYIDEAQILHSISNSMYCKTVAAAAARIRAIRQPGKAGSWAALSHGNDPLWHAVFFGLLAAGYDVLLLDHSFDEEHALHALENAQARLLVGDKPPTGCDCAFISFTDLVACAQAPAGDAALPSGELWGSRLAYCTSGTTGSSSKLPAHSLSKVLLSVDVASRAIASNADLAAAVNGSFEAKRALMTIPLNHNYCFELFFILKRIGAYPCFYDTQSVMSMMSAVKKHDIAILPSVPLVWSTLFQIIKGRYGTPSRQAFVDLFGERFSLGISTGSALADEIRTAWANMGMTICNAYGASETPYAYIGVNPQSEWFDVDISSYTKRIRRADGSLSAEGEGELVLANGAAFIGYLRDGEIEPAPVDEEGFIATGDIFALSDGRARFLGRCKNVIFCQNGKNVYPEELEKLLSPLSNMVEHYRIVGVNDAPALFVYCGEKGAGQTAVTSYVNHENSQLEIHKRIRMIAFSSQPLASSAKGVLARAVLSDFSQHPDRFTIRTLIGKE